ncbi:hypothetical protein HUN01_02190 (plasmid) [Nostoc edaphicum CCNP1411]|uniref:Uncharacterized protein n=1 Tax=Nostoc edaphicum CCNP1411 TaxID=1472755 RepID=A0A7D7L8A3_9NOSO|nr:hypothetical protein HUN01_02190 [Nostoc edaphicum CCNP1411]
MAKIPGIQELNRLLAREGLLWCPVTKVAQQSFSERFLVFPSELFEQSLYCANWMTTKATFLLVRNFCQS